MTGLFLGYVIVFAEQLEQLVCKVFKTYKVSALGEVIAATIGIVVGQRNEISLDGVAIALPFLVVGLFATGGLIHFLDNHDRSLECRIFVLIGIYFVFGFFVFLSRQPFWIQVVGAC